MYSRDLAHIHDRGFGELAMRAGPELVRLFRNHAIRSGRIVEIGAGSGILARHLVDAGYEVVGFDLSPAMVALARGRVPEARFSVASLTRAGIPKCRAVVALGEVVSYVPGGIEPLRRFFSRVWRALEPGGLFVFDFMESGKRRTYAAKSRAGDDWALVASATLDRRGRVLTRRMTMFRKVGGEYRRSSETHRVYIHYRQEIEEELVKAGFRVIMRRSYGSYRLLPGDVVVVAVKANRKSI